MPSDALLNVGIDFAWCQTRFRLLPKQGRAKDTPRLDSLGEGDGAVTGPQAGVTERTPEQRMRPAALIVVGVGGLLSGLWLTLLIPMLAFVLHAHAAQSAFDGSVERRGGNHGGTFLHPQFRFRTDDGREMVFTSKVGSTDQPYEDGQRVRLLYDPTDPTRAYRGSLWDLWLAPLATFPFAILPLGIGLLLLRDSTRKQSDL